MANIISWLCIFSWRFGGLGLYHNKKISDLSEKYTAKIDCNNYRSSGKDDFVRLEDKMEAGFSRIYDKLEKLDAKGTHRRINDN